MDINPLPNENTFDIDEKNDQDLFPNGRHPVLFDEEKYFFEKQIYLSMLRGEITTNCIQQPSNQELSVLSYGVRKLFDQNNFNNNFSNSPSSDLNNSGIMPRILCFFSKYLDNRSPIDCAKIWKYVQGRKEIIPNPSDREPTQLPETFTVNKYRKNSIVYINKRKIAVNKKKEILLFSLDSSNKETVNISEVSLLAPYIDSFAAMTLDGKIYTIKENSEEKIDQELLLNTQKPLLDFRISQTITPIIAALTNDSQNIIFGHESSYKEYKFTDKIIQLQIDSSNLCFSTKSSFYILNNDRISTSYEYSRNLNDFRILNNGLVVLAFGDTMYEIFDMRIPDKIFSSSFQTGNNILDCQVSPLNNLFCFCQQNSCSIYDFRNPNFEIMSFEATKSKNASYQARWIGDDRLIAVANDDGYYNLVNITSNSAQILQTHSLQPGKILNLNTTDDTVIITQPSTVSIYQMNTRPILLPNLA